MVVNAFARKAVAADALATKLANAHVDQDATAQLTAHAELAVNAFARREDAAVAAKRKVNAHVAQTATAQQIAHADMVANVSARNKLVMI